MIHTKRSKYIWFASGSVWRIAPDVFHYADPLPDPCPCYLVGSTDTGVEFPQSRLSRAIPNLRYMIPLRLAQPRTYPFAT